MSDSVPGRARRAVLQLAALVACTLLLAAGPYSAASPRPQGQRPVHARLSNGIDVSGHSGAVDWPALARAGHTFAFVKATEGVDLKDHAFDAHWAAMKAAGIVRGAYHFYVTEDDPAAQAAWFARTVTLGPGDLAPVVDLELIGRGTITAGLVDRVRVFLAAIERHYGVKPIIYTAPNFWDEHIGPGFGAYPLWLAEYGVDAPRIPKGWDAWHLWQWKGDAAVEGVAKTADLSRANRSGVDLSVLVIK